MTALQDFNIITNLSGDDPRRQAENPVIKIEALFTDYSNVPQHPVGS